MIIFTKKRLYSFSLGFLFTLFTFEVLIHFIHFYEKYPIARPRFSSSKEFRILTLGNSHTVGIGASPSQSYPAQLEAMLNVRGDKKYQVLNFGQVNVNTTYIKEQLPDLLKQYNPNLVFIMAGEANYWNRYGFWQFLEKNKIDEALYFKILDYLRFFKTYQFIEIMINNYSLEQKRSLVFKSINKNTQKMKLGYLWIGALERDAIFKISELNERQADEAIMAISHVYAQTQNVIASRLIASLFLYSKKDVKNYERYLNETLLLVSGFDYELWRFIQKTYVWSSKEAKEYFKRYERAQLNKEGYRVETFSYWEKNQRGLKLKNKKAEIEYLLALYELNPSDVRIFESLFRRNVKAETLYEVSHQKYLLNPLAGNFNIAEKLLIAFKDSLEGREKVLNLIEQAKKLTESDIGLNKDNQKNEVDKWIADDLEAMALIAKENNVQIVFQTYIPYRDGNHRQVDNVIRQWIKSKNEQENVVLMDLNKMLAKKFDLKNGGERYYSTRLNGQDEHAGPLGYQEIAKAMLDFIP